MFNPVYTENVWFRADRIYDIPHRKAHLHTENPIEQPPPPIYTPLSPP